MIVKIKEDGKQVKDLRTGKLYNEVVCEEKDVNNFEIVEVTES